MKNAIIRNLQLEDYKEYYTNVSICTRPIEFEGIACSIEYLAFRLSYSCGSVVGLMNLSAPLAKPTIFTLNGHEKAIQDIQFNPHNQKIMASCGDDGLIVVWNLNDLAESNRSYTTLKGHAKRCSCISWNPVVSNVLASSGNDQTVVCWDVEHNKSLFSLNLKSNACCSKWNMKGSLLAYTDESCMLNIIDIRLNKTVHSFFCHDEQKKTKVVWADGLCETNFSILSTGFKKGHFRQIKLWDLRKTKTPVYSAEFDSSPSALYPVYEEGLGIIALVSKGESIFRFFTCSIEHVQHIPVPRSAISHGGFGIAPKSLCLTNKCEILKFYRIESRNIYTTSVCVPRNNVNTFCADLYPDVISSPTYSIKEWISLKEKSIVREPFTPVTPFKKYVSPKAKAQPVPNPVVDPVTSSVPTPSSPHVPIPTPAATSNTAPSMSRHLSSIPIISTFADDNNTTHSKKKENATSKKKDRALDKSSLASRNTGKPNQQTNDIKTISSKYNKEDNSLYKMQSEKQTTDNMPFRNNLSTTEVYTKYKSAPATIPLTNADRSTKKIKGSNKLKTLTSSYSNNKQLTEITKRLEKAETENKEMKKYIAELQNRMNTMERSCVEKNNSFFTYKHKNLFSSESSDSG